MANWELLDKAFYSTIDNMSDDDWNNWHNNQEKNQMIRHEKMQNDLTLHLRELVFKNNRDKLFNQKKVFNSSFILKATGTTKTFKIILSPRLLATFYEKPQFILKRDNTSLLVHNW